jgi:phage pi2 protein 07
VVPSLGTTLREIGFVLFPARGFERWASLRLGTTLREIGFVLFPARGFERWASLRLGTTLREIGFVLFPARGFERWASLRLDTTLRERDSVAVGFVWESWPSDRFPGETISEPSSFPGKVPISIGTDLGFKPEGTHSP